MLFSRSLSIGVTCVFIATVAWSTAGLFTRVVSTDIPTTLLWRSLFGGLSVLLIYIVMDRPSGIKQLYQIQFGEFVIALFSTMGMMCFISAFFYTSIANVAFVYGSMPLITMLVARMVLKDQLTFIGWISTLISTIGVTILIWGGQSFNDFMGIGLAFLMTIFMALVTVFAKIYPRADALKSAYISGFLAAFFVFPFSNNLNISQHDFLWLALYGLVNVGLGFGVYLYGVARITALTAALIGILEIPLAPIWAYFLFNEEINASLFIGGSLILLASLVYIVVTSTNKSSIKSAKPS